MSDFQYFMFSMFHYEQNIVFFNLQIITLSFF